ncbi:MAG: class I SAM-dependent methyltransferase [Rhodospirillales bacterium]|nr:class I SAM-dependent methyltransferase [Rhodospirillales bacterium]
MHPTARFWDRIAERYAKKPVADEAAYQKKLQITRDYFRPDMEVLEFGCGTGSTALVHAPFVKHILATDISANMIEIAERKAKAGNVTNVDFRRGGFDELEAADSRYDVVLGLSILHLLADRDEAISKVHRLLKPGGVFVSSTPCIGDSMAFFKFIGPIGRVLGLLPLLRVFTVTDLKTSLIGAGFEIEHEWQPGKRKGVFIVARKPA